MDNKIETEINKEYQKLCNIIGDAIYRIKQYEELIETTKKQIDTLNQTAGIVKKIENKT